MEVDALLDALAAVLERLGGRRGQALAAGIAGVAESGAPLDATGGALAPIMACHDPRGEEAVAALERRFGPELALRAGQTANTKMTVSKLGWLLGHGLQGMAGWLGVPELALRALTGAHATEYSLAARTGCFDVVTRAWIPEVAAAVGFAVDLFPPVLPAGAAMGRVSEAGAAWSGLPEGIPVTIAGHDHLAGMVGAGVALGEVANSVGTAETLVARMATVPDMATASANRVAVTVYPGGEEWAVMVGAARAGLVIEVEAAARGRSPADLDALGEQDWVDVLGGLTARTVEAYHRLTRVLGPPARVVVFGGGSASAPWLAAKQAALPVPVVASPVRSAPARGAAVLAGRSLGEEQVGQADDLLDRG
jgi:xylulokinase